MFLRLPARCRQLAGSACLALAIAWCNVDMLWARQPHTPEPPPAPAGKSYVLPYALVGLCMGLGLFTICRGSSRSDKAKVRPQDELE